MVKQFKTRVAKIASLLNDYNVEYIVVGAEACNVHGIVRGTKDVDVLIYKSESNVKKTLQALENLPLKIAREILPEEVLKKPFTIVGDMPRVDLLFNAGKLKYAEAKKDIFWMTIEGVKIPFASVDSLILSKQTDRAKDLADLEVLEEIKKIRNHSYVSSSQKIIPHN